jgi:hypothetical protein
VTIRSLQISNNPYFVKSLFWSIILCYRHFTCILHAVKNYFSEPYKSEKPALGAGFHTFKGLIYAKPIL